MSSVTVNNAAELQSALASAQGGDTISLAAGNYGNVGIYQSFAADVTITAQTAGAVVFNTLDLSSANHVHVDGVSVQFTPTASTYSWSPAVQINNASNITITHSTITSGPAVNGVAQDAASLDGTGNVIGMGTGYGINVLSSTGVTIDGVEISNFYKGIVLNKSSNLTISHDNIHDTRTTAIVGAEVSHVTIDSNHIHDANPWHWGSGDHADFLALWTNSGQTVGSTDIKITNNLMEQGKGTAVLGMWMAGGDLGFSNVTISHNTFLDGNFQGITLWDTYNSTVDHNTLLQTSGVDFRGAPGILLSSGAHNISVTDNVTGSYNDQSGSTGSLANTAANNHLAQMWDSAAGGYYTSALVAQLQQIGDYASIFGVAVAQIPAAAKGIVALAPGDLIQGGATDDLLTTVLGNSTISGGAGSDTIYGGPGPSYLRGEDGNDVIIAQHGFNDINGNAGNDTIIGGDGPDWLVGGKDNDLIQGGTGNQILYGNLGDDTLIGGPGSDIVRGGQGNDSVSGGAGDDWISGDRGDDVLVGGAGADTFHIFNGSGVDTVLDFNSAQGDRVVIDDGTAYTLRFVGANTVVDMGTAGQLVLVGVNQSNLGDWLGH